MSCLICKRHSVICGGCGKCVQEHCECVESCCLKCGRHMFQPLVETDLGLRLRTLTCECGGQLVPNPRTGGEIAEALEFADVIAVAVCLFVVCAIPFLASISAALWAIERKMR